MSEQVTARSSRQPLPVARTIALPRACGHTGDYRILVGEPEAYEANRRKKWLTKRCRDCALKHMTDANERAAAEAKERRGGLTRKEYKLVGGKFRLPSGSTFTLVYHATDDAHGVWVGELTTPTETFGDAIGLPSVHRLIARLGRSWRKRADVGASGAMPGAEPAERAESKATNRTGA